MDETLNQKKEYWNKLYCELQTKKNEHKFTKVNSDSDKVQKQKMQNYYQAELDKIKAILNAVDTLVQLESEY